MAETPLPQSDAAPPDAPQPGTNSVAVSHCHSQVSSLKRKNNKESDIWQHFSRPDNYDPKIQYTLHCGHCDASVKWLSANGTSAMRNHMKICPKFPENINANSHRQKKITSVMKSSSGAENVNPIALWKFSQDVCREELARMIILDELAFKFVENEGFRRFCSMMQPLFKPISRVTIAKDCMALYAAERKKLKSMFLKSKQRICLTTDAWTSNQNLSYMCLTSHWIDKDWNLHKKILNFCVISSHKGEAIGRRIEECLVDWGIQKLCTLTVDNATSNDTAITYLKRKFFKRNDSFILGGRYFQLRCCAHVLNLIVKDGLDELDGAINRIRAAVKYARSSPQRAQIFKSCVEKEGIDCRRMLCLDVTTRWNSTFLMLETAAKFEKVFDRMIDDDDKFKKELEDVGGPPTFEDWEDCRLLTTILQKFYDATTKLSGTSYVTSHLYFSVVSSIENKLNTLMCGFDPCLKAMAVKMKLKFHKYWEPVEKMNMMLLIAIVLDPRYKLTYVSWCYEKHFKLESSTVVELTEKIMDTLNTLYVEYQQLESCNASSSSQNDELEVDQPIFAENDDLSEEYEKHMAEVENNVDKNEVKQYLDFPREKGAVEKDGASLESSDNDGRSLLPW
ncbi:hypothetical protein MRB53_025175 [Persea americana]|uniref:Uncharacterized protein n=1 Tax=Persea americana TaxID=3435 RepID=A0ACC2LEQ8_PERAE|nr:hypothetical protein MRB53_025175 [Persea americana]